MTTYQTELWQTAYWRRGNRYYHCELKQNLFADWVLIRSWGTIGTKRGRQMENYCSSFAQAQETFKAVFKRREYRNYQLVSSK
ncbi:WGR domain-containing protein [Waterburya agarophytonicola K14]|uniref:WGR domain-containing protein n=1 Tax=Waterburya agarophytonicola KI4 TaxID=2874699 RepID=A0A964BT64_9CYAN|nr:WGR domain-containing protein [Waterburya agarophytonicola]MCC0178073.1 WGR domain-containing protein [Waterburya agarophytonicola KI4]